MLGRRCVVARMQQPTIVGEHELPVGMQQQQQQKEQEAQVKRQQPREQQTLTRKHEEPKLASMNASTNL